MKEPRVGGTPQSIHSPSSVAASFGLARTRCSSTCSAVSIAASCQSGPDIASRCQAGCSQPGRAT